MEPVTQEFVEQTADFMMHLTKKQLDERVEELKKQQFNIHRMVLDETNFHKKMEKKDYIWRLNLILTRCFESYQIKLPMISMFSAREIIVDNNKQVDIIMKEYEYDLQMPKCIERIGQPHFFHYFEILLTTDDEFNTLFIEKEAHSLCFCLMTIGIIYSKTLERYS